MHMSLSITDSEFRVYCPMSSDAYRVAVVVHGCPGIVVFLSAFSGMQGSYVRTTKLLSPACSLVSSWLGIPWLAFQEAKVHAPASSWQVWRCVGLVPSQDLHRIPGRPEPVP